MKRLLALLLCCSPLSAGLTWDTPTTISSVALSAFSNLTTAMNADGNGVVSFRLSAVPSSSFQAATFIGTTWTAAHSFASATIPPNGSVTTDFADNALAVWHQGASTTRNVFSSTEILQTNPSWGASSQLSTSVSINPLIQTDASSNAIAIWERTAQGVSRIYAATMPFGGAWTAQQQVSTDPIITNSRQLAVSAAGTGLAIWSTTSDIQVSFYTSGSWSVPATISAAGPTPSEPQVAFDPSGNAIALWTSNNGGSFTVQADYYDANLQTWSGEVAISGAATAALNPHLAIDRSGNTIAIWNLTTDGTNYIVQTSTSSNGTTWSMPETISTASTNATLPAIAAVSTEFVAVWKEGPSNASTLMSSSRTFAGSWEAPVDVNLSLPELTSSTVGPVVAVNDSGKAVAAWPVQDGTDFTVKAAFTTSAPEPISNLQGTQRKNQFLLQTERSNLLSWTASPSSGVSSYIISRNGTQIATLSSSQLSYTDPNRSKNVTDTYSVVAVNADGIQSTATTISVP